MLKRKLGVEPHMRDLNLNVMFQTGCAGGSKFASWYLFVSYRKSIAPYLEDWRMGVSRSQEYRKHLSQM